MTAIKKPLWYLRDATKRIEEDGRWLISPKVSSESISLFKFFSCKVISVVLRRESEGYVIKFPDYIFESSISHFAPAEEEKRLCRNKTMITSLIKMLKRVNLWDSVSNKDFLRINKNNKRSSKKDLKKELTSLTK